MYSDFFPPVFKGTGDKPTVLRLQGAVCFENSEQDFSCMIAIGFKLFQKKKWIRSSSYEWISTTYLYSFNAVKAIQKCKVLAWFDHQYSTGGIAGW